MGNTLAKLALFKEDEVVLFSSFANLSKKNLETVCSESAEIKNVILSSVVAYPKEISSYLKERFNFLELSDTTKLTIENLYQSNQTLGKDRLACAVGANSLFRNTNVLSVDAGTCIKFDFINSDNQYLGGGISPGIDIRFKALNAFTDKLPLLTYQNFEKLIGQNTEESILSGVLNGVAEEVKGIVKRYQEQYPDLKVVCTGGYIKFFERIFNISGIEKSNIFADSFLLLKGLNQILKINA